MLIEHDVFQNVEIDIAGSRSEVKEYFSRQLSRLHKLKLNDEFEVIYDKNYDRLILIHELRSRRERAKYLKTS